MERRKYSARLAANVARGLNNLAKLQDAVELTAEEKRTARRIRGLLRLAHDLTAAIDVSIAQRTGAPSARVSARERASPDYADDEAMLGGQLVRRS